MSSMVTVSATWPNTFNSSGALTNLSSLVVALNPSPDSACIHTCSTDAKVLAHASKVSCFMSARVAGDR